MEALADLGCWWADYDSRTLSWSGGAYRLHGVTPLTYKPTLNGYVDFIPPEERGAFRQLLDRISRGVHRGEEIYRIVTPAGDKRWLRAAWTVETEGRYIKRAFGTFQDVTSFKRVEHDLDLARSLAMEGSLDKIRFLAAASHDLRQPVQAIELLTAVLRRRLNGTDLVPMIEMLGKVSGDLSTMLTSLLDITRHQAGAANAAIEEVPLAPLLHGIVASARAAAEAKELRLSCRVPDLLVLADRTLLDQIVRNLVTNALKYTERGGLLVAARRRAGQIEIMVSDTGPGIPEDKLDLIFEEFRRLEGPSTEATSGVGLGLAIAQKAARLMGSRVQVRSRTGRGSTFSLLLPIAGSDAGRDALPSQAVEFSFPGLEICVIDDDDGVRATIASLLRSWGARPIEAGDILSLMATIAHRPRKPRLIISDYQLSHGEDGIEAIRVLRRYFASTIPAVLLTARAKIPQDERPEGVTVLRKPVSALELGAAIEQAMEGGPAPPGRAGHRRASLGAAAALD